MSLLAAALKLSDHKALAAAVAADVEAACSLLFGSSLVHAISSVRGEFLLTSSKSTCDLNKKSSSLYRLIIYIQIRLKYYI